MTLTRKPPKAKTCKVCRTKFEPRLPMATCCSPFCALTKARLDREKAEKVAEAKERKETKAKLLVHKKLSKWASEAQEQFNLFIRLRDDALPCISCGRHHKGQYHAGHFLSVGARPELRFNELNVHKQCSVCNNHKGGNALLYRKGLIEKHGVEVVDFLEGPHPLNKFKAWEYETIKLMFAAKAKTLKAFLA